LEQVEQCVEEFAVNQILNAHGMVAKDAVVPAQKTSHA
jgi:hypothetical protein